MSDQDSVPEAANPETLGSAKAAKLTERLVTSRESLLIGIGLGLLLVGMLVVGGTAWAASDGNLTPLEATLFSSVLFLLSTAGAVVLSFVAAERRNVDRATSLAKPAVRRAVELNKSAQDIRAVIKARAEELVNTGKKVDVDRAVDWLKGYEALIDLHIGQLGAAIADWQDLLPEEFSVLREEVSITGDLADAVARLNELERKSTDTATTDALKGDTDALKKKISKLESELRKVRSEKTVSVFNTASLTPTRDYDPSPLDYDLSTGKFTYRSDLPLSGTVRLTGDGIKSSDLIGGSFKNPLYVETGNEDEDE